MSSIDYYMGLPYRIQIEAISKDDGGGFCASLSQFGIQGIVGDGETEIEAIADLRNNQKARFQYYIDNGLEIPSPFEDTMLNLEHIRAILNKREWKLGDVAKACGLSEQQLFRVRHSQNPFYKNVKAVSDYLIKQGIKGE